MPIEYSLWSDLVGAATPGTRLAVLDRIILDPGPVDQFHIKRHEYAFECDMARSSAAWDLTAEELVIRVQHSSAASDFDEWRIRDRIESVDERGRTIGRLECVAPVFDLDRSGIIEWIAADGATLTHFEALKRTPTTILGIILGTVAPYVSSPPAHFKIGTVDPTDTVDFVFEDDTAWTAVLELAKLSGVEFSWDRDPADDQYRIHLLNQIGSAAKEVRLEVQRNVFAFRHKSSTEDSATRITPTGAEIAGERASVANNAWEIQAVGATLTMLDDLVLEDDQLNLMGLYALKPDGTLTQVTDSAAPNSVTLADMSGLSAGDLIRFRRNSAGADMSWLSRPSEEAKIPNPPIAATLPRPDIPPVDNEASPNAFLTDWAGGLPTGYAAVGAATITQNTNELHTNFGGSSARVVCPNTGDGIARVSISVAPSTRRPYFTPQGWMEVISGAVEMQLYDVTNAIYYPEITATERAVTDALGWFGLGMQHGIDHNQAGTIQFELYFTAAEPSTEFYLDGIMLTNTLSGVEFDAFLDGRGSNLLWFSANDELAVRPVGLSTYELSAADLNRRDAVRWPDEPLDMGVDVRVVASTMSGVSPAPFLEVRSRLLGRRRFLEHEARTELELETERERLTRLLPERKRRPKRSSVLDHLKPPRCNLNLRASLIGADLVVEWDRTNWARVQLRDVTGLTGTPKQRWDAGIILYTDDGTKWTLLDGETTPQGASPGQIKTIMIEAYNRWGKPGECYQLASNQVNPTQTLGLFKCDFPNLLPDTSAGQTHCTADCVPTCTPSIPAVGTPPIVLHTFKPLVAAASPSITPGVTTISLCHEGSTSGQAATEGYGMWLVGAVPTFDHHMFGTLGESQTRKWHRDTTVYQPNSADQKTVVGVDVQPETGQVHQWTTVAGGGVPKNPSWDTARDKVHDPFGTAPHAFRPAWVAAQEDLGGDSGTSYVYYGAACRGHTVTVKNLSNQKLRLTRSAGPYWAATTITSTAQTGDFTWDLKGVNNGVGPFDRLEILSAADVVQATFLGSEMPSGNVWPGSTIDFGGPFTLSPLCLAINAAADLCLEEDGFICEEDWAAASSIDTSKYLVTGFVLQNGRLEGSDYSSIIRMDVGVFPGMSVLAVVQRAGASAAPPGPAGMFGTVFDVQSTLRATFRDGGGNPVAQITGTGVSTGDLNTFAPEQVLQDHLWPANAVDLVVEQLHMGTDPGEACSRLVQLNVGPQCCPYVDPSDIIIGLPGQPLGCLQSSAIATLIGVDTCAGGQGVQWDHYIFWNTTDNCVGIDASSGYFLEVLWFEEHDPTNEPGVLRLAKIETDPIPIPTGWTVGDPPVLMLYRAQITIEDLSQVAPIAGANRGNDGINPRLKQWRAEVRLKNQFIPNQNYGIVTSNTAATPNAYDWCP